jgi:23S rRNA pseudouridine1911/1915/1917 synthase
MKTADARVEDPAHWGARLDVFISEGMGLFSRSQAKARVVAARVNGKNARLARRVKPGDLVSVDYTDAPPLEAAPQDIPLDIIFENEDAIVINKPQGMVVHPGSGNREGTLVNALLFHCAGLAGAFGGEDSRPGIVHRLDKDTSGVIIAAKNPRAHEFLASQFKARRVRKSYLAVVMGLPEESHGRVETGILRDSSHRKRFICVSGRGRAAVTYYKVLRSYRMPAGAGLPRSPAVYGFLSLAPRTGRTHQLRVHMRHLSTPILGDPLYGKPDARFPDASLMLHAHRLSILLPGEEIPRIFAAPLPERLRSTLRRLHSLSPR